MHGLSSGGGGSRPLCTLLWIRPERAMAIIVYKAMPVEVEVPDMTRVLIFFRIILGFNNSIILMVNYVFIDNEMLVLCQL